MTDIEKKLAFLLATSPHMKHKLCYGKCDRCVWRDNGGCSEWNGRRADDAV